MKKNRSSAVAPQARTQKHRRTRFSPNSAVAPSPSSRRHFPPASPPLTGAEPDGPIRLNRYLSMCGVASRRKADELIASGRVAINGLPVTDLGVKIVPGRDRIRIEGKEIVLVHEHEYLVFNKPKDAITTMRDEKGRRTVMEMVQSKHRVYPIGRLDRNTTGVLLLTSDGEFAHHLMHPKFRIPKSYRVRCDQPVSRPHLQQLRSGIQLEDGRTGAARVVLFPDGGGRTVGITIHEGRNRQVRRMFEALGYNVQALDRVAYGPVTYEGLPRGKTRRLSRSELRHLRELAGLETTVRSM